MAHFFDRPLSKAIASITFGALLAGVALYFMFPSQSISRLNAKDLALKAMIEDGSGVAADSSFLLSSSTPLDIEQVKTLLNIQPEAALAFTKKSDTEIEISATEKLKTNKVYQFSIPTEERQVSWAFQIKGEFHITSTLPGNESTRVPTNSGIEITFTHDTYKDFEKYFSITPKVSGKFEKHRRTMVFIPSKLESKTIYTVTIKKGLPLENSNLVLEEDRVFQFETDDGTNEEMYFETSTNQIEWSTTSDQNIGFMQYTKNLGAGEGADAPQIGITAYKIPNKDAYIRSYEKLLNTTYWATFNRYQLQDLLSTSTKIQEFNTPIRVENYTYFTTLPEKLSKGYYLLAITHPKIAEPRYLWAQVTNVSAYMMLNKNNALVWTNDLQTKKPIANAKVTFSNGSNGSTDATGIAKMPLPAIFIKEEVPESKEKKTPDQTIPRAEITAPNGDSIILFLNKYSTSKNLASQYYTYLYTDRPVYKQNDKVHFWGIVKPKENAQAFKNVTARLVSGSNQYSIYNFDQLNMTDEVMVQEKQISISPIGTFTDSWNIKNLPTGWYNLQIMNGDDMLYESGISIESYTKPSYTLDIKPAKEKAMTGETVNIDINARFFEGTPVPFKKITLTISSYNAKNGPQTVTVTTDKAGRASYKLSIPKYEDWLYGTYWPKTFEISGTPVSQEEGEISGYASISIFGPDAVISTKNQRDQNSHIVEIALNKLDYTQNAYKGAPLANYALQGTLIETHYDKVITGQTYDFISKKTIDKVEYIRKDTVSQEIQLTTDANGNATFKTPIVSNKTRSFKIQVKAPNGHTAEYTSYIGNSYIYDGYSLTDGKEGSPYAFNEKGTVTIEKANIPAPEDTYLFITTTDKETEYTSQASPKHTFTFVEKMAPRAKIEAVRFSGETYETLGTVELYLDLEKEKKLSIEISSDKQSYDPGDDVKLAVKTSRNGKPVSADTNISLVDEAYFELFNHDPTPLTTLHGHQYFFWWDSYMYHSFSYASHTTQSGELGGRGGGGGDERKTFLDTAFFGTVTTNSKGEGEITFKLPDNLTSWHVTAQAVDMNVLAGVAHSSIPVRLPFFVDAVIGDDYLMKDQPIIQIRSFGEKLPAGTDVTFKVKIPTLTTEEKTFTGKAFDVIDFPLPPLKPGKQTITVSAEAAGMKDMLTRQFNVINSRLTVFDTRTQNAAEAKSVPNDVLGAKGNIQVTIQNTEKARLYNELWREIYNMGSRFDEIVASEKALSLLKDNFKQNDLPGSPLPEDIRLADIYQGNDGGVRILPYADSDLELSVKAAIFAREFVDEEGLKAYFAGIVKQEADKKYPRSTRERYTMAVSGLAALHQPVLIVLQNLSKETDLSPLEKLYLTAGSMAIGDQGTARKLAEDLLTKHKEVIAPYTRLKVGTDTDDIITHTALMAVIAADLNLAERDALAQYVFEQSPEKTLIDLERNAYIAKRLPFISSASEEVTYSINGQSESKKLENEGLVTLNVPSQLLTSFKVEKFKGDLSVTYVYERASDGSNLKKDPNIGLTRTYILNGKAVTSWKNSDIVIIELKPKFGDQSIQGCYSLTDHLPSGVKPLSWNVNIGAEEKNVTRPYIINGQETKFCVSKESKTIRFPVRMMNKGTFFAEPAIMQISNRPGSSTASDAATIKIE